MVIRYVKITDAQTLKEVGCPWKAATLRQAYHEGKYPGMIQKRGRFLVIDVEVMEEYFRKQNEAPTEA